MPKPRWTSYSFLIYAGGLIVLGSAVGSLAYLARSYSSAANVGWSFLVLAVLYAIAHGFRIDKNWLAAGIFAYASVVAWAIFVIALWHWFGWLDSNSFQHPFHGFSLARLSAALLVLAAVADDRRRFEFPFITSIGVFVGWFFVADLISGGGDWTAVVTLLVGIFLLGLGVATDEPSSFWYHLGAGIFIGGALLHWWHSSDLDWALIAVTALVYVSLARVTKRSSWAVLGAAGLIAAGAHFAVEWSSSTSSVLGVTTRSPRDWVPYAVFAFVGFLLVALGLRGRRRGHIAAPPTAPPPPPA
jgi:hypothetical protein